MSQHFHRIVAAGIFAVTPFTLAAQAPLVSVPIDSGQNVRLTTLGERLSGRLLVRYAPGDSALRLCNASWSPCGVKGDTTGRRNYSSAQLLRVEVERGNHAKTGAIIGGVAGGVVGGVLGLLVAGFCDAASCHSLGHGVLVGALVGGLPAAAVGGVIGSLYPKWGPAP